MIPQLKSSPLTRHATKINKFINAFKLMTQCQPFHSTVPSLGFHKNLFNSATASQSTTISSMLSSISTKPIYPVSARTKIPPPTQLKFAHNSLNLASLPVGTCISVFTDGSCKHHDTLQASAGFGVFIFKLSITDFKSITNAQIQNSKLKRIEYHGELLNFEFKNCFSAELTGLCQALVLLRDFPRLDVQVYLDCKGLVDTVNALIDLDGRMLGFDANLHHQSPFLR